MPNASASDRGLASLFDGARSRVTEALAAWIDGDFDRAAASAPTAVELLVKAALWRVNPVLLVPLETKGEAALVALATEPNLDSPALRTIGLRVALARLTRLRGDLPVPAPRQERLVACRNGGLHVGALPHSGDGNAEQVARWVLTDCLTLCDLSLVSLERERHEFYDMLLDVADTLITDHATEVDHTVARAVTQADARYRKWCADLEDEELAVQASQLREEAAADSVEPADYGHEMAAADEECPVCGYNGRLVGRVDVEPDVDIELEDGGPSYYGRWKVSFFPSAFMCNVCKLDLTTGQQLEIAGIESYPREVRESDLGPDFDAALWHDDLYNPR